MFARVCTPDAHELGELGEELAARSLLRAGLAIEGRRVRTPHAEIDIVAFDASRRTLVVVEVKTARFEPVPSPRGTSFDLARGRFRAGGRLGAVQTVRLQRAAAWLAHHSRRHAESVELRLVEVWLGARPRCVVIEQHLQREHQPEAGKSFRTSADERALRDRG